MELVQLLLNKNLLIFRKGKIGSGSAGCVRGLIDLVPAMQVGAGTLPELGTASEANS